MKLWLLRPIHGHDEWGPWKPWYDKTFGFVVRAETEDEARLLASKQAGDEGHHAWMEPFESTCVELTADGPAGVVIQDHCSA